MSVPTFPTFQVAVLVLDPDNNKFVRFLVDEPTLVDTVLDYLRKNPPERASIGDWHGDIAVPMKQEKVNRLLRTKSQKEPPWEKPGEPEESEPVPAA